MRCMLISLSVTRCPLPNLFKVPMKRNFISSFERSFKMLQNGVLLYYIVFYCDSTLGCRVIQDFNLCKLDDL